ncbi:MAG: hypothetical protein JWR00_328 [Rubritepida sp.]|nr:hypothetical protein [Rubritepida sp.]
MHIRTLVSFVIASAALVWAGVLWVGGAELGWALLKPYGFVVTVVGLLALAFEATLWRLPIIRSMVVKRPSLVGTWQARLESNYKQPDGSPTVKTVYVVIAQTLTTLSLRMFTDKAHSRSLAESIRPAASDALFELAVVYQNIPDIDHRFPDTGGAIHFGALLIPNVSYSPTVISGHYWTDRRTEGKLTFEERRPQLASSYREAQQLFSRPRAGWLRRLFGRT